VTDPAPTAPTTSLQGSGQPTALRTFLGDRARYLIPTHLTTVDQLLIREKENGIDARRWALSRRRRKEVLTVAFLIELHRRMFRNIWTWAGQLRRTDHPEGARWPTIGIELNDLVGEARFWSDRKLFAPDDLALRFHHSLLRIRAWEGGSGSHARLAADALVVSLERPPFNWGMGAVPSTASARERYLAALREADRGAFHSLRDFARSM
jgi:Fic-DOC domain mobile mystery protein B